MVKVAETFKCDFCSEEMPFDETGVYCAAHVKGGHAFCGLTHFKEEH